MMSVNLKVICHENPLMVVIHIQSACSEQGNGAACMGKLGNYEGVKRDECNECKKKKTGKKIVELNSSCVNKALHMYAHISPGWT